MNPFTGTFGFDMDDPSWKDWFDELKHGAKARTDGTFNPFFQNQAGQYEWTGKDPGSQRNNVNDGEQRVKSSELQIRVIATFNIKNKEVVHTGEPFFDPYEKWYSFSIIADWYVSETCIRRWTWSAEVPLNLQYMDEAFAMAALPQLSHPVSKKDFPPRILAISPSAKPTVCFTQEAYDLFKKLSPINR